MGIAAGVTDLRDVLVGSHCVGGVGRRISDSAGVALGMGAAEAGIFPCATGTLARWFPSTRRAMVSGILGSFMGIGGALGAALTGWLLDWMDWRWMFLLYAVPGVLWAAWFAYWFRNRPRTIRPSMPRNGN